MGLDCELYYSYSDALDANELVKIRVLDNLDEERGVPRDSLRAKLELKLWVRWGGHCCCIDRACASVKQSKRLKRKRTSIKRGKTCWAQDRKVADHFQGYEGKEMTFLQPKRRSALL